MKNKPQILIVDDDINILKVIKKLLNKYNLNLYTTDSPSEALKIIEGNQIDLIISDQRMPEMEGLQLLNKIKEISPGTLRILMSGYSDVGILMAAINSGSIYQYIPKPWENENFLKTVFKALEEQIEEAERNTIFHRLFQNRKWIQTLSQTKLTRRSDFFNNIIKYQPFITPELQEEATVLEIELDSSYRLCLLSVEESVAPAEDNPVNHTVPNRSELIFVINMLPNCMAWSCSGYICILVLMQDLTENGEITKPVLNITGLVSDYYNNNYSMGISNVHSGLEELKISYSQAYYAYLTARNLNRSRSGVTYYEKLGALQLLAKLNGDTEAEEFVENMLGKLVNYDMEKGSNLLLTLEEFLKSDNLKEAAGTLYIHPKTMIFRKNRIEKILDITLDDYETRLSLGIAIKLLKLK